MNIKEMLQKLKKQSGPIDDKTYEFDEILENHPLGNQNLYRLYFLDYYRFNENYENKIGLVRRYYEPFMLPEGMTREDGFKVLSYLSDYIEREANIEPCSLKSTATLNKALDIKRLGFKKVNDPTIKDSDIINLFTIAGRVGLFKDSNLYNGFYKWYKEGITFEEVKDIYQKIGIEFYDIIPSNNDEFKSKEYVKSKQ